MKNTIPLILVSLVFAAAVCGCNAVNGNQLPANDAGVLYYPDGGLVSGDKCSSYNSCGEGRYCSAEGICTIECTQDKECSYYLPSPDAGMDLKCSKCGRCIKIDEEDKLCKSGETTCLNDQQCKDALGDRYLCSPWNYCTTLCAKDSTCTTNMGRGFFCTRQGDVKECTKACTWDLQCQFFGFNWKCDLPVGINQYENTYPPAGKSSIVAECVEDPKGVDWGPYVDPALPSYKYHGIYAAILNTATTSTGTPLINEMNTVSSQWLLMKVTQAAGGKLAFSEKWCTINLLNFQGDSTEEFTAAKMITPDRYADYVPIQTNTSLDAVPAMAPGVFFQTDQFLEVRGAKLANPAVDPLPDYINCPKDAETGQYCKEQFDQDKDGNPGMTTMMIGIVGSGEIYNAQRWTLKLNVEVLDENHIQGLLQSDSDQKVIDSTNGMGNYTLKYAPYKGKDRSYYKMVRMPDNASCSDVVNLGKTPGSFIEYKWICADCK